MLWHYPMQACSVSLSLCSPNTVAGNELTPTRLKPAACTPPPKNKIGQDTEDTATALILAYRTVSVEVSQVFDKGDSRF